MNKVILMGRLTKDPELRYTQTSMAVTNFTIAVRNGVDKPAWFFNIVAWNKTADFITKYFAKGNQIVVVGKLTNRDYEDKDGNKRQVTEVVTDEVYFADSRNKGGVKNASRRN